MPKPSLPEDALKKIYGDTYDASIKIAQSILQSFKEMEQKLAATRVNVDSIGKQDYGRLRGSLNYRNVGETGVTKEISPTPKPSSPTQGTTTPGVTSGTTPGRSGGR